MPAGQAVANQPGDGLAPVLLAVHGGTRSAGDRTVAFPADHRNLPAYPNILAAIAPHGARGRTCCLQRRSTTRDSRTALEGRCRADGLEDVPSEPAVHPRTAPGWAAGARTDRRSAA